MKKPSSRIREEIARLQEQLKQAETREAERIGRIALRGGLGDIDIDDVDLLAAFEEMAARFRERCPAISENGKAGTAQATTLSSGQAAGPSGEV